METEKRSPRVSLLMSPDLTLRTLEGGSDRDVNPLVVSRGTRLYPYPPTLRVRHQDIVDNSLTLDQGTKDVLQLENCYTVRSSTRDLRTGFCSFINSLLTYQDKGII